MFYDVQVPDPKPDHRQISALVVLTPAESRRTLSAASPWEPRFDSPAPCSVRYGLAAFFSTSAAST